MRRMLLLCLAALLVTGCAGHVLSKDALEQVDEGLETAQVLANPEAFIGRTLLLGGPIVDIQVGREGTVLEILSYRLDRWGEPRASQQQNGRFLVRSERFLDPEIYKTGTFVTMTGTVAGSEIRTLGNNDYRYPVLEAGEVHRWPPYNRYYSSPGYFWPSPYWSPYQPWSPWGYPYYFYDPWYRPWSHPGNRFWW